MVSPRSRWLYRERSVHAVVQELFSRLAKAAGVASVLRLAGEFGGKIIPRKAGNLLKHYITVSVLAVVRSLQPMGITIDATVPENAT